MTDEFQGVTRDEYQADRLLSTQDWADWRAARGWEAQHRPTHAEMVAQFAAERGAVERESLEGVAERAVVHDGWRTYPDPRPLTPSPPVTFAPDYKSATLTPTDVALAAQYASMAARLDPVDMPECDEPARHLTVHATLLLTADGDPTIDELRNQLAGLGFDTIDIEEI